MLGQPNHGQRWRGRAPNKLYPELLNDMAIFVETGQPSPRQKARTCHQPLTSNPTGVSSAGTDYTGDG